MQRPRLPTHASAPDGQLATAPQAQPEAALPAWDLSDLYPGVASPEIEADFAEAERAALAFETRLAGKLPGLDGASLAAALGEYQRIEEIQGRLMSYAQLAVQRQQHRPGGRPVLPIGQRARDRHQQPPAVLHARTQPHGRGPARRPPGRPGSRPLAPLAARPARLQAAPAQRPGREAAARERGHRPQRLEPPVRRNHRRPPRPRPRRVAHRLRRPQQAVRPRPLAPQGCRHRHRRRVQRQHPPVRPHHQHARQGQGDHRHLAPLQAPDQLPQPRQHGRGRGGGRAQRGRHRRLRPPLPPLLRPEGQVARPRQARALGPQRAPARGPGHAHRMGRRP